MVPVSGKRRRHGLERSASMVSGLGYQPSWAGWNKSKRTKNISRSQAKGLVLSPSMLRLVAVPFSYRLRRIKTGAETVKGNLHPTQQSPATPQNKGSFVCLCFVVFRPCLGHDDPLDGLRQ